jgi:aminomethyltransferase
MPIRSPFHECTSKLNDAMRWRDWGGFFAAERYGATHEPEYHAFRQSAGLMDYTPLFKYEVTGKDAAEFLARVMVRDIRKLKVGQVAYCCWCDDNGNVIDDGTVTRQGLEHYRVTAAEPSFYWFERYTRGYDVTIHDSTEELGALSLQGPRSRDILVDCCPDMGIDKLKFFRMTETELAGCNVSISRTGYTGDLGYEIWCEKADGVKVWEEIMAKGENHLIKPCGLDALDITRVEAGFIMNGVDYHSANHVMIEARKSTPYELGLGWCVNLDREPFNGQAALRKEKAEGSDWATVGVELPRRRPLARDLHRCMA